MNGKTEVDVVNSLSETLLHLVETSATSDKERSIAYVKYVEAQKNALFWQNKAKHFEQRVLELERQLVGKTSSAPPSEASYAAPSQSIASSSVNEPIAHSTPAPAPAVNGIAHKSPLPSVNGDKHTPLVNGDRKAAPAESDWAAPAPPKPAQPAQNDGWAASAPPAPKTAEADGWGAPAAPKASANDGWGAPQPTASSGNDGWGAPQPAASSGNDGWGAADSGRDQTAAPQRDQSLCILCNESHNWMSCPRPSSIALFQRQGNFGPWRFKDLHRQDICGVFNMFQCSNPNCRRAHRCVGCGSDHHGVGSGECDPAKVAALQSDQAPSSATPSRAPSAAGFNNPNNFNGNSRPVNGGFESAPAQPAYEQPKEEPKPVYEQPKPAYQAPPPQSTYQAPPEPAYHAPPPQPIYEEPPRTKTPTPARNQFQQSYSSNVTSMANKSSGWGDEEPQANVLTDLANDPGW